MRVEVHAHTEYSNLRLLDSINKINSLVDYALELGLNGICITDHECLSGHVKLMKKRDEVLKDHPFFHIGFGNEIYLTDTREKNQKYYHFILIAKDRIGYKQLCKLSSVAWMNSYEDRRMERVPTLKSEIEQMILNEGGGHLIATTSCFRKGSVVLTKNGKKNIEDVTSDDFIYNRYGKWEKVNFSTKRQYNGEGYKINFYEYPEPIICTKDHQFLVSSNNRCQRKVKEPFDWVSAQDLNISKGGEKDYCLFPLPSIIYNNNPKILEYNGIKYKKVYIKSKEKITMNEEVHCLNVDTHSFTCGGVIVHNCIGGELGTQILAMEKARKAGDEQGALESYTKIKDFLSFCQAMFGDDFYLEVAPARSLEQILVNKKIKEIARVYNLPMVIGSDAHYLKKEDRWIHEAYLNSKGGEREVASFYEYAYLQAPEEELDNLHDVFTTDEIIQMWKNSCDLGDKIENFSIFANQDIPRVHIENVEKDFLMADEWKDKYPTLSSMYESDDNYDRYWVTQCIEALRNKDLYNPTYISRLEEEADIKKTISEKLGTNMFRYPITLQHYIDLFWECGSLVGAGRGSSCSGLNHYLLGVTQLDPIQWNLPFWRYLNKERVELGEQNRYRPV